MSIDAAESRETKGKPPARDGVAAATVHLPEGQWSTVLDCLASHFATIPRTHWVSRFERGLVLDAHGRALALETPYRVGMRVHYYREIAAEPVIPFAESVLHVDQDLVVIDKPHFLPVSPVGGYVRETLLTRLHRRMSNPDLVPLHRIDRGTAGIVLFSARRETRGIYQTLFREHRMDKRYEAIAAPLQGHALPLTRHSRLVRGQPFVRTAEVAGEPNAQTHIDVEERSDSLWRYTLRPITGKKHQLRVHMSALHAPILNDELYPQMALRAPGDFTRPLQLLARSIEFTDPLTGEARRFLSERRLLSLAEAQEQLVRD